MASGQHSGQSHWNSSTREYSSNPSTISASSSERTQNHSTTFQHLVLPGDGMESRTLPAPQPSEFTRPTRLVSQTVIDLTGEDPPPPPHATSSGHSSSRVSRPPWFPRDIIDVDALPDAPDHRFAATRQPSPDVELTFARTRVPARIDLRRVIGGNMAQPVEPNQFYSSAPSGVSHGGTGVNDRGPVTATSQLNFDERLNWLSQRIGEFAEMRGYPRRTRRNGDSGFVPAAVDFPVPEPNYRNTAFELISDGSPDDAAVAPSKHNYLTPKSTREGFTRSPKEGDVIICPNCDDELTAGENEVKRSVWVAKCGHVYCGECTKSRKAASRKKALKSKNPPFAICRVEGCHQRVSAPTAMFQLYL
ncbi:hypothetical protein GP486_000494 [Trichoglossum hirsutum]|uniref:RING-type domain-containing protein n=1 Tax=Trichoglossum hirsutum TaxID=265104 RepID=A0A9P8RTZ9_9PEZI|nr:hypothetical protein GP486_000494 [Trichoglossum hirsutum]